MKTLSKSLLNLSAVGYGKLKSHRLLGISVAATLTFGLFGYSQVFPDFGFLTLLYMTVQLFLLDSQVFDVSDVMAESGGVPWALELSRWMAAALTFYGLIFAASKLLRRSGDKYRIEQLDGHSVVFGADKITADFLEEVHALGQECVLISSSDSLLEKWRSQGHFAVDVDAGAHATLQLDDLLQAGLPRAKDFYILDTDDAVNLRALLLAAKVDGSCSIKLRQDEPFACDLLQRHSLFLDQSQHQLRVISVEKQRARLLLQQCPLEWDAQQGLATEVHLVLPHFGAFEKSVAIQAALIGHYKSGKRVILWLSSPSARAQLVADFPEISRCLDIRLVGQDGVESVAAIGRVCGPDAFVTVLYAHLSVEQAYLQMLRLEERWAYKCGFRIIASGAYGDETSLVKGRPNIDCVPQPRGLVTEAALVQIDRVAQAIHKTWYDGNQLCIDEAQTKGELETVEKLKSKATFKLWDDLSEEQKDTNRSAADHIEVKIRAAGLNPKQPDIKEVWSKLDAKALEMLSRMEHERWAASLWLANWQVGERDDVRRKHNDLVPYDDLDPRTKRYDDKQVCEAAKYCAE